MCKHVANECNFHATDSSAKSIPTELSFAEITGVWLAQRRDSPTQGYPEVSDETNAQS